MKIIFIQTGGTIDKDYPKLQMGYAFEITEPASERILRRINPNFEYEIVKLFRKDSLDMSDNDRKELLSLCKNLSYKRLIITHGTDTMLKTAEYLSGIRDKTIVLTGAFRPEKFYDSDAGFNLGVAVAAVQILPPSVYVAMSGRIYHWDDVERHPESGQFVQKTDKQ